MAVLRGKKGGVSSKNKDWRSYYGPEAYDSFVKKAKEEREKWQKEQQEKQHFNDNVLKMKLFERDENGEIIPGSFRMDLIEKMNSETYEQFLFLLTQHEKKLFDEQIEMIYQIYMENYDPYAEEDDGGYDEFCDGDW